MSRCFPFPPPGYEKKPRSSEHGDVLAKEKHREKKHKKEKKDKEKGENKERKEKDRSKEKHKEKKDKKEKHKDKKKDKDRDKDKNKTSEGRRTDHLSEAHHEDRLGYESQKAEEVRDSKFTEELGRRSRDEQGAAKRMVEDFSATTHRRIESIGASSAMGKESVMGNKMVTDVTGTVERRNEKLVPSFQKRTDVMETATTMGKQKAASSEKIADRRRNENLTHPMQKRVESLGTSSMETQGAASNQKVGDFTSAEQRNHFTGRPMDNVPILGQRRTEGTFNADSIQKERMASNNIISNSIGAAMERNDELDRLVESITSSIPRRIENMGSAPTMEKERSIFPNIIGIEQRRTGGMGLPVEKDRSVEKDTDKKAEGKEKTKEKTAEDGKREGHKDRDRNEKKRKEKDKDRHKEKKKEEKKREKGEHKHKKHDKLGGSGLKDQIDSINNKTLAPHIKNINTAGADGNNKRKVFETNGFLHEPQHDGRPNKLPRVIGSSSHPPVENGRPLEIYNASQCSPIKLGVINNTKIERDLDNNGNHINGKAEFHPSHVLRPPAVPVSVVSSKCDELSSRPPQPSPVASFSSKSDQVLSRPPQPSVTVVSSKSDQVSSRSPHPSKIDQVLSRPPHPDTKYLGAIYSIPKVDELLESDDQGWLFSSEKPRSNTKLEDDETPPQVMAKGLQIESADIFALPYVIPF